jgi:predicted O-methyltransferase YrrM
MINNIPGWMKSRDLDILSKLSALCPKNSSILEIGSFLGRSTYSLYTNKKESVSLTVIDAFEISKDYHTDIETYTYKLDGDLTLALEAAQLSKQQNTWQAGFKKCIGEEIYSNINVNVCKSTSYNKTTDFDLVFIDGGHEYDIVKSEI